MPRSKNIHIVRKTVQINQPNDPTDVQATGEIDMAKELSRNLGRTIKQNQSFRVIGWGAYLTPKTGEDLDSGASASVQFAFCPTTKWSVKGHKMLQDHYWKQSAFRRGLGINSKYDEFEVSLDENGIDSRTSEVYVGGINDPEPEACTLYGPYDDEDGLGTGHISAHALVDAKFPVQDGGTLVEEDLLFDDEVNYKDAKFNSRFPNKQYIGASATYSTEFFYDHDILLDEIYESGAIALSSLNTLPDDNHFSVLAGRVKYWCHALPRDDENFLSDGLNLTIYLLVEGWSPLHYKPKRKKLRKGKTSRRRTYRRKNRG